MSTTKLIRFIVSVLSLLFISQAGAVTLTFDEAGATAGSSAETFYAAQGVTFSGGGLLADGASGGNPGQPIFSGGTDQRIVTQTKTLGQNFADSFFDIWIHFDTPGIASASGEYWGNSDFGGQIGAYAADGTLLDLLSFAALGTSTVQKVYEFHFSGLASSIAKIHMISTDARVGSGLNNLNFSVIPIPAAIWLFGTALVGLIGFGRRKTA